jgi:pentose-5-phosphate-3-epimerase
MAEIIPAILSKNYADLKNKISLVRGIAPIAQIDICDGAFVKSITWPFFGKNDDDTFLDNDLDQHFRRI